MNGMFTPYASFQNNVNTLMAFQKTKLNQFDNVSMVNGSYNENEDFRAQFAEVTSQKYDESAKGTPEYDAIRRLIGGATYLVSGQDLQLTTQMFTAIMTDLNGYSILRDADLQKAKRRLESQLKNCTRTIIVGHSQGNFYSNALITSLYGSYNHQDGSSLSDYKMLGYMGLALPTSVVGGAFGSGNPEYVNYITNDNDYVMAAVRSNIGAVPANYNASFTFSDWTGHALGEAYLHRSGQASVTASKMASIVKELKPFPLHNQNSSGSSAFKGMGYSKISRVLDIEFNDKSVYRYLEVPEAVWNEFTSASSKGGYFNKNIRNNYSFEQLN